LAGTDWRQNSYFLVLHTIAAAQIGAFRSLPAVSRAHFGTFRYFPEHGLHGRNKKNFLSQNSKSQEGDELEAF